jgi:hypothetical protein
MVPYTDSDLKELKKSAIYTNKSSLNNIAIDESCIMLTCRENRLDFPQTDFLLQLFISVQTLPKALVDIDEVIAKIHFGYGIS